MPRKRPRVTKRDISAAAALMGRKGGLASKGKTSPAKAAAARANGKLGGRPLKRASEKVPAKR